MGKALIGQGHLAGKQVEVEACEDAHQGGDGNEAVGNTGLKRGNAAGQLAMPSQWITTPVLICPYFQAKTLKIISDSEPQLPLLPL